MYSYIYAVYKEKKKKNLITFMENFLKFCTSDDHFLTNWHIHSVDPDQTASSKVVLSGSTVCLFTKLSILRNNAQKVRPKQSMERKRCQFAVFLLFFPEKKAYMR